MDSCFPPSCTVLGMLQFRSQGSKQACHHRRMFVHNYIPWQHLSDSTGKCVIQYGAFCKHHSHAQYVLS